MTNAGGFVPEEYDEWAPTEKMEAQVSQRDEHTWLVTVWNDSGVYDQWIRHSHARAVKKAERELARAKRNQAARESWTTETFK